MWVVWCAVAALGVLSAVPPARHEVTSLPGWYKPLPSKMYAGFVDAGVPPSGKGTMYFHYWMVQAENDPANAPVVIWYNGGPGASSLYGLLQELGPLFLNVNSFDDHFNKTGIPSPQYNPHTWSKNANLIAIDSPPPVGFSFCSELGPSGQGTSCGPWKDSDVFKANHAAVTALINKVFPELKPNPLFITGESYAGVYVPGLIQQLLRDPQGLNLKGYAVGDGCMGYETVCLSLANPPFTYPNVWPGPYYELEFFHGHGQYSNELDAQIRATCPEADLRNGNLTAGCLALVAEVKKQVGGFFVYDLYDDCPSNEFSSAGMNLGLKARKAYSKAMLGGAVNDYACSGNAMDLWVKRADVRTALGVPVDDYFFNADNGHGFSYTMDVADIRSVHVEAASKGMRVVIYEGDSDASGLSSVGLQDVYVAMWKSAGLNRTEDWRPWTSDGKARMGGYAMEWAGGQVSHLTIRGSGHMVPLNKPIPASTILQSLISGKEVPRYNPKG